MKLSCAALLALTVVVLPSCGGSKSPSSPSTPAPTPIPVTRSVITVSGVPSPIVATNSGNSTLPLSATWTTVITETAGLAANVNLINVTARDVTTNAEIGTLTFTANQVAALAGGSAFLASRGTLNVPMGINYRAGTSRQIVLTVTAQVIDASGNQVNGTVTINVV